MMGNILEKYHNFPGFALLLGSLLWYTNAGDPQTGTHILGIKASSYLIRQQREGHILDDTGFSALWGMQYYPVLGAISTSHSTTSTLKFLAYFKGILENPERSKTHVFDQQRYSSASKECLQICLCNHHHFSNRAVEFIHRDNALRRSKPWLWRRRLGIYSRIRKCRHRFKVQRRKLLTPTIIRIDKNTSFLDNSPEHEYCRSLSYRWALDLLPFFLERSAISLDLAEVLRRCTFTTMGQKFPRRMKLAKDARTKYLLRAESGVSDPMNC